MIRATAARVARGRELDHRAQLPRARERLLAGGDLARVAVLLELGEDRAELRAGRTPASRSARRRARSGGGGRRPRAAAASSSRATSRWASIAGVGVLAARGEPVGDGEDRDVGAVGLRGAQVAPDRAAVERALVDEEAGVEVVERSARRRSRAAWPRTAGGRARRGPAAAPAASWPRNVTRPPGSTPRVCGLAASCSSAAQRIASPRVSSSESGSASSATSSSRPARRVALEQRDLVEHLERVVVDVEVVEVALLDALAARSAPAGRRRSARARPSAPGRAGRRRRRSTRLSSAKTRSGATRSIPGALARRCARRSRGRASRSSSTAIRIARRLRSGSSSSACARDHPDEPAARRSRWPPCGSTQLAAGQRLGHRVDREVALGEVGVDVVVAQRDEVDVPRVLGRDHPPGAERAAELERRARGPPARACARAACGSPGIARSMSSVSRPSSRSRTAPPTSHAGSPASAAARGLERLAHVAARGTRGLRPHVIS